MCVNAANLMASQMKRSHKTLGKLFLAVIRHFVMGEALANNLSENELARVGLCCRFALDHVC